MPKLINGKIVLLAIGLSSLMVSGVSAMYYINIFSSATDASREASATVFAGLSEVMAALSAIERSGEMSAGSDALGAAEAFLLAAQKGFTALVDSDVSQQFVTLDGLDLFSEISPMCCATRARWEARPAARAFISIMQSNGRKHRKRAG